MKPERCHGFTALPKNYCYPIDFRESRKLYVVNNLKEVMTSVKSSFMVHFWNMYTSKTTQDVRFQTPYVVLARKYCPKVFGTIEMFF